jgi:hypothetical protein
MPGSHAYTIAVSQPDYQTEFRGSILTTLLWIQAIVGKGEAPASFIFWVSVWLWFTVLFANFAEAMAEGRGKAQAASLRKARRDLEAKRLRQSSRHAGFDIVSAAQLKKGDLVMLGTADHREHRPRGRPVPRRALERAACGPATLRSSRSEAGQRHLGWLRHVQSRESR